MKQKVIQNKKFFETVRETTFIYITWKTDKEKEGAIKKIWSIDKKEYASFNIHEDTKRKKIKFKGIKIIEL